MQTSLTSKDGMMGTKTLWRSSLLADAWTCLDILGFLRPHSGNSIRLRATMRNSRAETHESICCHLRWRCHCNISLLNASSQDLYTIWQYDGIARRMCFPLFLHVFPLAAFERGGLHITSSSLSLEYLSWFATMLPGKLAEGRLQADLETLRSEHAILKRSLETQEKVHEAETTT